MLRHFSDSAARPARTPAQLRRPGRPVSAQVQDCYVPYRIWDRYTSPAGMPGWLLPYCRWHSESIRGCCIPPRSKDLFPGLCCTAPKPSGSRRFSDRTQRDQRDPEPASPREPAPQAERVTARSPPLLSAGKQEPFELAAPEAAPSAAAVPTSAPPPVEAEVFLLEP